MTRYLFFFSLFFSANLFGQLQGSITDASSGSPLPFANIISNTGIATLSGYSGDFILKGLSSTDTIITVSYLGYQTQDVKLRAVQYLAIKLIPQNVPINEITISSGLAGNHLKSIAGHISLLSKEDLTLGQYENLSGYLNMLPGIFMASGSANTNKISIRGIGSRTLYGTNRIKMYYNDIPITSADGITSPEDVDLNNIAKIEIIKGPSSALYGSGLGGSVHINTYWPNMNGFTYGHSTQYGSFNQVNTNTNLNYSTDALHLNSSFTYSTSEGYRQNSAYARKSILLNGTYSKNRYSVSGTFVVTSLHSEIPSSIDYETFVKSPQNAALNWLNNQGYEDYTRFISGVSYKKSFPGSFKVKTTIFSNYSDGYERRPFNVLDDVTFSAGFRGFMEYSNNKFASILGAEAISESYKWKIYETEVNTHGALLVKYVEKRYSTDLFQLNTIKPMPQLTIELGINFNFLEYRLSDEFASDSANNSGSYAYPVEIAPKAGINYGLSENLNVYFSLAKGFSPPTVEETLLPEGQINPDLKPETGWNIEAGARGQILNKTFFFEVSIYQIILKNLLVNKRVAEDIFSGINAGKTNHFGLELNLNYQLRKEKTLGHFLFDASTSFWTSINRFKTFTDEGIDYAHRYLPGIPTYSLNTKLKIQLKSNIGFELEHRQIGNQFMNDANTYKYKGYGLAALSLYYKKRVVKKHIVIFFFHLSNLFNTRYASMISVNAPSFGSNLPRYYYPGNPFNFKLGIRITNTDW